MKQLRMMRRERERESERERERDDYTVKIFFEFVKEIWFDCFLGGLEMRVRA